MKDQISSKFVKITEHLTQRTTTLLRNTQKAFKGKAVWTEECKVFVEWGRHGKCIPDQKTFDKLVGQTPQSSKKPASNTMNVTAQSEPAVVTHPLSQPENKNTTHSPESNPAPSTSSTSTTVSKQSQLSETIQRSHADIVRQGSSSFPPVIRHDAPSPRGYASRNGRGRGRSQLN